MDMDIDEMSCSSRSIRGGEDEDEGYLYDVNLRRKLHSDLNSNLIIEPNHSTYVIASHLFSSSPKAAAQALNTLLRKSFEADANYMLGQGGHFVAEGLALVFDRCIHGFYGEQQNTLQLEEAAAAAVKKNTFFLHDDDDETQKDRHMEEEPNNNNASTAEEEEEGIDPRLQRAWNVNSISPKLKSWIYLCRSRIFDQDNEVLLIKTKPLMTDLESRMADCVLVVVRNLSFVAANCRFIVHCKALLRLLCGVLFCKPRSATSSSSSSENKQYCLHAVHALTNLAPYIDISGRRIFLDFVMVDERSETKKGKSTSDVLAISNYTTNALGMGLYYIARRYDSKDDTIDEGVSDEMIRSLCAGHIDCLMALFPLLVEVIKAHSNKQIMVATLELLNDLMEFSTAIFQNCSEDFVLLLVDLLGIPKIGPDAIDYLDPIKNDVPRVTAMKVGAGYDNMIDSDIRDRSLEILEKLSFYTKIKKFLGTKCFPKAHDYLLRILISRVGRNDASQMASKVLANMSSIEGNKTGLLYLERKLLVISSVNPQVANISCNHILNNL